MRIGINPEKNKKKIIRYKLHRIIIPVYIPTEEKKYFDNLFEVFKISIGSLLKTTSKQFTNITIINNNCNKEVTNYINSLIESNLIDKHIHNSINKGKVNSILSEVRSCHEEVITIADADVFYFSNWQFKTLEVFKNFKNIGVVAPLPCTNIYSYCNMSFFSNILKPKKKGFIISKKSCELFGESVGYDEEKILRLSLWKKPQFYIKNSSDKVCLGAGHFVASYRGNLLHKVPFVKNKYVFKNGDEFNFLDRPIDVLGYYRVSLIDSYAYHLGNSIPIWVRKIKLHQNDIDIFADFKFKKNKIIQLPYSLRVIISSLWHKLNKI